MSRWLVRLFLAVVVLIPLQKRYSKPFREFFYGLIDPSWNVPTFFEKNFGFYTTDIPLLLLLVCLVGRHGRALFWEGEKKLLLLFVGIAFLSILGSSTPAYPLHYFRLLHFVGPLLFFGALSQEWVEGKKIFTAIFAVALFECSVGILQYFCQDSIGLKFLGEPSLTSRHVPGPSFWMPDGTTSILDYVLGRGGEGREILRASGTLPHPNILGGFLVFSLIASYFLFGKMRRVGYAIALQIFTLFLTFSRAAIYGWLIASAVWFLLAYFRQEKPFKLLWVLGFSSILSLLLLYPQLVERGGIFSYTEIARASDLLRLKYQDVALQLIRDHPILGVGFDHFLFHLNDYGPLPPSFVHNIYLLIASEMGLLGLGCFCAFLFCVLKKGWENRSDPLVAASLSILVGFLFLGLCDFYLIFHQQGRLLLFLASALISRKVVVDHRSPARAYG
jgi:O-antigen ligase